MRISQTIQCSKGNTSKSMQPIVMVLCFALCLMVFNICVKFHENVSDGFDVTERTLVCGRNGNFQCSKSNNSKSMQSRVMVFVSCMSSYGA